MKTIPSALNTHFGSVLTTVAACWTITRADGTVYRHTSHDELLVIGGETFSPTNGTILTQFQQTVGLGVDTIEVLFELSASGIAEADIAAGLFDGATVDVFLVNWASIADGQAYLCQGWVLGNIEIRDNVAQAEVRGLAQHLGQNLVELYSPGCRAELGDSRCGVDFGSGSSYIEIGTVSAVTDRQIFVDSSRDEASDVFAFGLLTWTGGESNGGLNTGFTMEVAGFNTSTKTFTLFMKMPYDITVGDTYQVRWGCDKSSATCKTKFNNLVNFRGEPFVPGPDKLLDYEVQNASK